MPVLHSTKKNWISAYVENKEHKYTESIYMYMHTLYIHMNK